MNRPCKCSKCGREYEGVIQSRHRLICGDTTDETAVERLRQLPFEVLEFATIDHHRALRCGFPEVIYCPGKTVEFMPKDNIIGYALGLIRPGDLVITLGAGDITKISDELAEKIRR